ncbi:winged helix-turn-helix domain-containing protein [Oceanobacillus oncorhynchi]|uniref:winged helix-turn-helix domain-containing protein n=1 Tax=Oceanobacillus oncorhynchi TaxID=545501 RepID=UPI001865B70A|nr:winged helix-turn-helix domain-containing protein [Oceanobacillus oncorhynchi]
MIQFNQNVVELSVGCFLDLEREALVKDGSIVLFSRVEYRIIKCIVRKLARPVSFEEIIDYVWGTGYSEYIQYDKEKLYVYIHRIRKRIEDSPSQPKHLLSVQGFGYLLSPSTNL